MKIQNFDFLAHTDKQDVQSIYATGLEKPLLIISEKTIDRLVYESFKRLSFTFTKSHIEHLISATLDPQSSNNDRYVCASLLKNAQCAASYVLPLCQDTGIAHIFSWSPQHVLLPSTSRKIISEAVFKTYKDLNLRYSTVVPVSFFDEKDPSTNLPCQTFLFKENLKNPFSPEGEQGASFLFCAKGGGSSNKTVFIQGTKADLNEKRFTALLKEKIVQLGTSACPPYTIAVVVGGLSPEQNLLTLKLATCGHVMENEESFRDSYWEKKVLEFANTAGYGAQFGGKKAAIEAIVIRLPRHGASCPISLGVSCSAHRNLKAFISPKGIYLEKTITDLSAIDGFSQALSFAKPETTNEITVNTEDGIDSMLKKFSTIPIGQRILISGKILVARDAAHAKWKKLLDEGKPLPEYTLLYPICYAGPSRTPPGFPIGSFGPTTAGRMDSYADVLMSKGAARITLAKGNRGSIWKKACKKYKSVYLGTLGGAAALITSEFIVSAKVIDYSELGMEAVQLVEVKNLPAFVLINEKGEDFYEQLSE